MLVSGGGIGRVTLFYNKNTKKPGLVSQYDFVALDEVQTISLQNADEVRGALKGYLEHGTYSISDYQGEGRAGLILLGNIEQSMWDTSSRMYESLPKDFQESALIDRFHGFICGWEIPRMEMDMRAQGWGLNVEYFSEILHDIRGDLRYRRYVEEHIDVPEGAELRDTVAITRIATAWLKLLFPHVVLGEELSLELFGKYCLEPAKEMRAIIRKQLSLMDREFKEGIPDIRVAL